jgi:hypothetical protein
VNKKRMRRLHRLDGLQLRMRARRRKHIALHRGPASVPVGPTERWSMDFVHDALADGQPFRVLTVVNQWSRQSPILETASSMSGVVSDVGPETRQVLVRKRDRFDGPCSLTLGDELVRCQVPERRSGRATSIARNRAFELHVRSRKSLSHLR